jgi:hypothetical protein
MTNLTPELNLVTAEDDDDIADYNVISLVDSLTIIDGMFNVSTGHAHNGAHQGALLGPNAFADNTLPGAKLVDGSVAAAKLTPGALTPDGVYANTRQTTGTSYTVAANIMFVFCTAAVTVTLPAAASTFRPITVWALGGQVSMAGGTFVGGSIDLVTGAVLTGKINTSDAITWVSDGTSWRAG